MPFPQLFLVLWIILWSIKNKNKLKDFIFMPRSQRQLWQYNSRECSIWVTPWGNFFTFHGWVTDELSGYWRVKDQGHCDLTFITFLWIVNNRNALLLQSSTVLCGFYNEYKKALALCRKCWVLSAFQLLRGQSHSIFLPCVG